MTRATRASVHELVLKNPDHWYPGAYASEENLAEVERERLPRDVDVIALLRETHAALYRD